jgi:hypothetical protein
MLFQKRRIETLLVMLFLSIATSSCSLFEPSSPTASYLYIDSIQLNTDYPTQGSKSSKISDAWVTYDGKYLGTFPLPAEIPLIGEGSHDIIIKAGIVENGISGIRSQYPKYASYTSSVQLSVNAPLVVNPVIGYSSGLVFPQMEDFEDASLSLVPTGTGTAQLVITQLSDPNAFEGNSGKTTLDASNTVFEVASSAAFALPLNVPSYLELDYKCDAGFNIGVFITTAGGIIKSDLLAIKSTSSWKKIYVNLSEIGGVATDGINYKIYIYAEKPSQSVTADLYFDNLKVVY